MFRERHKRSRMFPPPFQKVAHKPKEGIMRSSNIVRFVVNIALVILIASTLAACSDGGGNPNQPTVPVSMNIQVVSTTCEGVDVRDNLYCNRTGFPVKITGSWENGRSLATTPMTPTTFQVTSQAVPGVYTVYAVDWGLCDPKVNGCTDPNTGHGITVNGIRLVDRPTSTSFELTKDGQTIPR